MQFFSFVKKMSGYTPSTKVLFQTCSLALLALSCNLSLKLQQQLCMFDETNVGAEISGMVRIKSGSEKDLLAAVATVGPISVAVDASSKSFRVKSFVRR